MSAEDPRTGKLVHFVDKCLPFGASISCALFQRFSNALRHIVEKKSNSEITNYLDDFHFFAVSKLICNGIIQIFLTVCEQIKFLVAVDKTEEASECIVFLGLLLNGKYYILSIPLEKRQRAVDLLRYMIDKNKVTVKELQALCGFLNFLCRAIAPGRVFTRRMYAKYSNISGIPKTIKSTKSKNDANKTKVIGKQSALKPYHHIRLDREFKMDRKVWLEFLNAELSHVVNRPMIDLDEVVTATDLFFFSDASAAPGLGFGCVFNKRWIFAQWEPDYIKPDLHQPTIEYLELYALCAGILTWQEHLRDCRILIHCDNQAVVSMVNNMTSSCQNCMILLRILCLNGLKYNRRVFVQYVSSKNNFLSDSLSRLDLKRFWKHAAGLQMMTQPDKISEEIWPASKIWKNISR